MRYRLDRALRILRMLQSGKPYDPVGLTVELKVNRRTVYRDIALLREMGIEIHFDSSFGGYVLGRSREQPIAEVNPQQLQQALDRALSDREAESSIEELIRQVALILAGAAEVETTPTEDEGEVLGGDEPRQSDSLVGDDGKVEPAPIHTSDGRLSEAGQHNDNAIRTDPKHPLSQRIRTAIERTQSDEPTDVSAHSDWRVATESLMMLQNAVQHGATIECSTENPHDAVGSTAVKWQLRPIEVIVRRDEIVVAGWDSEGRFVQSRLKSVRRIQRDEQIV